MTLAGIAARNLLRKKFRSVLTIFGVAATIGTFVMLRTALNAWAAGAEYAAKDRLLTRHKVTFILPLPLRYVEDVRRTPGVKAATFANWFGAKDPNHPRDFFANTAVDSASFLDVYDDIVLTPADRERWIADRQGAIIGDVLAKRFGWKVGQKVILSGGIFPGNWQFTIDGIYTVRSRAVDKLSFYFHWQYLNEAMPEGLRDHVGSIVSRVSDPGHSGAIARSLDKVFEVREDQTITQSERVANASFLGTFAAVLKAMDYASIIILGIMMLILGNTIAMAVRERTHEYGVMRAIGFLPQQIATLVVAESAVTGLLGGALALLGSSFLINGAMGPWIAENFTQIFPIFQVNAPLAVTALLLPTVLGGVAGLVPAYRTFRLNVVQALRRLG